MTDLVSQTPRRDYAYLKLELLREEKAAREAEEKQVVDEKLSTTPKED